MFIATVSERRRPSQVSEGVLGQSGHGVAVEREQREVRHAVEGRRGHDAQQVEAQVQHLQCNDELVRNMNFREAGGSRRVKKKTLHNVAAGKTS